MDQRQRNDTRRLSILKPVKAKGPLVDVDINPPVPIEATFIRSRRVSFASNNFIKEFTTDLEKNTIWHVSYEESNRSDHSVPQTSSDNNDDDASDNFNCTKVGEFELDSTLDNSPSEAYTNNVVTTGDFPVVLEDTNIRRKSDNYIQDKMDSTTNHLNRQVINSKTSTEELLIINPETVLASNRKTIHFNQDSNSGVIKASETIPGFNESLGTRRQTIHFDDDETIGGDMEITETLTNPINPTNNAMVNQQAFSFSNLKNRNIEVTKTIHGFVNLVSKDHLHSEKQPVHFTQESTLSDEIPQIIPNSKRKTIYYNQESHPGDLEMTQSIPTHIMRSKTDITHCDTKPDTLNGPEINLVQHKFLNTIDMQGLKRQTIHFNHESNPGYMDMTYATPDQNKSIHTEQVSNSKRQTIHFNQESHPGYMDMTHGAPEQNKLIHTEVSNSKRQTIHFNQESNPGYMDMTHAAPEQEKSIHTEVSNPKRQTIHFNQESNTGNMDMTHAAPEQKKSIHTEISNQKRQTIHFNQESNTGNMDMTHAAPEQKKSIHTEISNPKRQTIHFNQESNTGNMDMTHAAPEQKKSIHSEISNPKRQTIHFNQESNPGYMDMTHAAPEQKKSIHTVVSNLKRQTIHFNQESNPSYMDMTNVAPEQKKSIHTEISNPKRQTIHFNQESNPSYMDMTNVAPEQKKPIHTEVSNPKRQTINFNQESSPSYMDMTNVAPEQKKSIHTKVSNSKRQTINFNQESNTGNMDMTQSIPAHIRSKSEITKCDTTPDTLNMPEISLVPNKFINTIDMQGLKRQTIHFNLESNSGYMDITHATPDQNKSIHTEVSNSKRQTIHFNQESNPGTMDMTKIIPNSAKFTPNQSVIQYNQTSNIGIDFKEQTLKSNNEKLTQAIPRNYIEINNPNVINNENNPNVINNEPNPRTKHQTIIYNEESNVGNMETTQSIPTHINEQKNSSIHSTNENIPSTRRQSLLHNQESNMADMEFTQVISKEDFMLNNKQQTDNYNKSTTNCEDIKLNQTSNSDNKPNICAPMRINQDSAHCVAPVITTKPTAFLKYQKNKSQTNLLDSTLFTSEPLMSSTRIENNLSTNYNKQMPNVVPYISNDQNIRQRNNLPDESFDICKLLSDKLNFTQAPSNLSHKSLNTINISTDNTEKLINFQIKTNPMSEYSKIINDDVNLPSLLCMTTGNCSNAPETIDSKLNHTEFHSLLLDNSNDTRDAPKCFNSLKDEEIQETLILDPNLSIERNKLQEENCVCAINNSSCENKIKPIIDEQIVNKRKSIKSDLIILVNSSSDSDSCYEVEISNKIITDEVNSNEIKFNEILEKNYATLPENASLVESFNSSNSDTEFAAISFHAKEFERHLNETIKKTYSDDLISKRALVKRLLDSLNKPQNHEKVIITTNESVYSPKQQTKVDILRERFEIIKNQTPNIYDKIPVKILTLEDKINDKSDDALHWSIISANSDEFQFFFMYETIKCIVHIDRASEIVKNVAILSQFCKLTSHPSAIYVHSILVKKLSQAHLKSAFGEKYTILSFVDYLTITGEQMIDIFDEFEDLVLQYALIIDMEMNATYKAVNSYLRIAFEITFNLSDLDHMTEECVSIKELIGTVRQTELKRLIKGCPQGIQFMRIFIMSVDEYLKKLEHANKSRQCIQSVV